MAARSSVRSIHAALGFYTTGSNNTALGVGTLTSCRRFKRDINDMGTVSEKLMNLRPVTFRYKDSAEKGPHALQYGLIAEEVAKVYPNLVQYDKAGKPFTIYYHLLTPMLLNELQKVHRRYEAMNAAHKADIAEMTALKSELASLNQAQQQQLSALTPLWRHPRAKHGYKERSLCSSSP